MTEKPRILYQCHYWECLKWIRKGEKVFRKEGLVACSLECASKLDAEAKKEK